MSFYSNQQLTDYSMSQEAGTKCVGYGAGASHERIIQGAGGEIGYDGFKDPRPNQDGNIRAERVFINERTNEIQGINFSKNGEFCCSYTGTNYADIKDSNRRDCLEKQQATAKSQFDAAEKGFDDAYAKGDMKAAKEYQEQIDRARLDAKEKDIQNEQQRAASEARIRH